MKIFNLKNLRPRRIRQGRIKWKKIVLIVGLILIINLVGLAILTVQNNSHQLEVTFFNVGQGDAIFIKTKDNRKILIDGGPDATVVHKLGQALSFFDRRIDLMILTHPHADHVGGLIEAMKRYDVGEIFYNGATSGDPAYFEWLKLIKEKRVPFVIAKSGQKVSLGDGIFLEILHSTEGGQEKNANNTSIVSKLVFNGNSFLFTGDGEKKVEEDLINSGADLKADILKVGHHGSDSSTTEQFLERVKPEWAVISAGENKFGLPSLRIIRRLERAGVKILRTDTDGDIKFIADGQRLILEKTSRESGLQIFLNSL